MALWDAGVKFLIAIQGSLGGLWHRLRLFAAPLQIKNSHAHARGASQEKSATSLAASLQGLHAEHHLLLWDCNVVTAICSHCLLLLR